MEKNIIVTVGISNSGKSTWAHELWKTDPEKYMLVSRDKIRELIFGFNEANVREYYSGDKITKREREVTVIENTMINEGLSLGKQVIVDATHLTRSYLERFKYWNVNVEVKYFPIMLKEALVRNESRVRKVPEEVIQKQYNQYISLMGQLGGSPIDFTPKSIVNSRINPPCVVFDIDNTLAIRGDRSPYSWTEVGKDRLDTSTALITDYINESGIKPKVIICTGRDAISAEDTERWLEKHHIAYDEIYYREPKDSRPDWQVKQEMWEDIVKTNYIVMMFDDRVQVCRRARALGLKVAQVEYGNF